MNPANWQLRVNLAEVLAHCGQPAEAADLFEQLAGELPADAPQRKQFLERALFLRR